MLESVRKLTGRTVLLRACVLGLAGWAAASLLGATSPNPDFSTNTPGLRWQIESASPDDTNFPPPPIDLLSAKETNSLPPPDLGSNVTHPLVIELLATNSLSTNLPPTDEAVPQPDLAETLALGFQLMSNLQVEREEFQQALDGLRRQIEVGAARSAQTIATGLSVIEPALARQQSEATLALQKLNQTTLVAIGGFGLIMLMGILAAVFILTRGMNRFAQIFSNARQSAGMLAVENAGALGSGDLSPETSPSAEQVSARFIGTIDRLEHRIQELEQITHAASAEAPKQKLISGSPAQPRAEATASAQPNSKRSSAPSKPAPVLDSHVSVLLGKGEALLNLGHLEEALQCFEEVLAKEPANARVMVKKGLALEQMQRLEEALESYDRALALDSSITAAYLYKGGICNQLQRHSEALECYEKALHTEAKL